MSDLIGYAQRIARTATARLENRMGAEDLRGYHAKYLLAVAENEGQTQDAVARAAMVNKSNAARQLGFLEERGYVERRRSAEDGRAVLVYSTEKARAVLPRIRAASEETERLLTEGLDEGELRAAERCLARLAERAREIGEDDR